MILSLTITRSRTLLIPFFNNLNFFKLLNEKNDDEDEETRAGMKKRNELLQQLMKDQDEETKLQEQQVRFDFIIFSL